MVTAEKCFIFSSIRYYRRTLGAQGTCRKQIGSPASPIYKGLAIYLNTNDWGHRDSRIHLVIAFWDCPDSIKWSPHLLVDKESKHIKIDPIFLSKTSWEFSRKEECDTIVKQWQMYFQASEYKGRNFLELNDNDHQPICPTYSKGGAWLKHFGLYALTLWD